jgi:hypothetical protein
LFKSVVGQAHRLPGTDFELKPLRVAGGAPALQNFAALSAIANTETRALPDLEFAAPIS